jgi:hypothetical protein
LFKEQIIPTICFANFDLIWRFGFFRNFWIFANPKIEKKNERPDKPCLGRQFRFTREKCRATSGGRAPKFLIVNDLKLLARLLLARVKKAGNFHKFPGFCDPSKKRKK